MAIKISSMYRLFISVATLTIIFVCVNPLQSSAASARVIDAGVDHALEVFEDMKGGRHLIESAKGLLVFPSVIKAGFGFGGEYGEGAMKIDGETEGYYNTVAASFGFQIGAQKKTIILAFMEESALNDFLNSSGWTIGADASVAVISVGVGGSIDTISTNQPILAFVFDQKGLMYNLTLEGAKITKIQK